MNQIFKFYKFRYNVRVNPENSVSNVEIKNNFNNENNDFNKNENENNEQIVCEIKDENNYIKDIGAPPATAFYNEDSK